MSAELAARRTAAQAVLADFNRAVRDSLGQPSWLAPSWGYWAGRLACSLDLLLEAIGQETPAKSQGSAKRVIPG